ncbi:hypothetical protein V8F06_004341 [Rhypophila decipiens]
MVPIKSIATGLLVLAASAVAAPAPDAAADIKARQDTTRVRMCEHPYWGGECIEPTGTWAQCQNVPAGWDNRASSVKGLTANFYFGCKWFEHFNCEGRMYTNNEDANLSDGDGFFDDRISSWRCP